jgi:hypothetical protein
VRPGVRGTVKNNSARRPKSRASYRFGDSGLDESSIGASRVMVAQLNGIPHGHDEFAG